MELEKVLEVLRSTSREIPRGALAEAEAHREEIIPELLAMLEHAANDPEAVVDSEEESNLLSYALYLLAQFREKRAYPLIIKFFTLPDDLISKLSGDIVSQDGGRIMASVSQGDTTLIKQLIENPEADEYSRSAALGSLLVLLKAGQISREEVMEYFKSLFHGKLEREPSFVWADLACCCSDIWPGEVIEDIREAFKDGRIDDTVIGLREVEREFEAGENSLHLRYVGNHSMIDDVAEAISWWSIFHPNDQRGEKEEDGEDGHSWEGGEPDPLFADPSPEMVIWSGGGTYVRETPKIGRNDPCPCGSGKKYKKCCGK